MKTTKVKSVIIFITAMFINIHFGLANIADSLKELVKDQTSHLNSEGFIIIIGIIIITTLVYLVTNYLSKKELNSEVRQHKTRILKNHHYKQLHSTKIMKKNS